MVDGTPCRQGYTPVRSVVFEGADEEGIDTSTFSKYI
jgi:hypothetical protein